MTADRRGDCTGVGGASEGGVARFTSFSHFTRRSHFVGSSRDPPGSTERPPLSGRPLRIASHCSRSTLFRKTGERVPAEKRHRSMTSCTNPPSGLDSHRPGDSGIISAPLPETIRLGEQPGRRRRPPLLASPGGILPRGVSPALEDSFVRETPVPAKEPIECPA